MEAIVKQVINNKKYKYFYFVICLMLSFVLALRFYVDTKAILYLLVILILGEAIIIINNIRQSRIDLNEKIIINENGQFNYKGQVYQFSNCKYIHWVNKTVTLYFEDCIFVLHNHSKLEQLTKLNIKQSSLGLKGRSIFIILVLLFILALSRMFANIIGLFYVFHGYQVVDNVALIYDMIIIIMSIGAYLLVKKIKKYQLLIYGSTFIISIILIFIPTLVYFDDVACTKDKQEVIVYNDVKYHFGKKLDVLSWQIQDLGRYENILYGKNDDSYVFYDLENSQTKFTDFLAEYENCNFYTGIVTISIQDSQVKINDKVVDVNYIGENTLYFNYNGNYLLKIDQNDSSFYDLDNHKIYSVIKLK